ncbi:hypothetical protein ACHHYP_07965 [Achlya hypogyna]|uniref:Uncharacterized protein n=1 Tax=Achlya hypogyna TaxID=1202772 RepID=A0A1V9YQ75_ACHHY|nr:hypothetical protein ACHHYP_07965 [Achlya hypogyna]
MYTRLTSIARQVWQQYQVPWDNPLVGVASVALVWPFPTKKGLVQFHAWSKPVVKQLCNTVPAPVHSHPMRRPGRLTRSAIKAYTLRVRRLRVWGMPVQYDVWYRAMLNMLPTGSKYWFMTQTSPQATICPYPRCDANLHSMYYTTAFTSEHCGKLTDQHGADLSWDMCMDVDKIDPPAQLRNLKDIIVQLASSLVMILLHKLWMHRNTVVFQDAGGPEIIKMTHESLLQWCGFVRAALRKATTPVHIKSQITAIVKILCTDATYAAVQIQNPVVFSAMALPRRIPRYQADELDATQ